MTDDNQSPIPHWARREFAVRTATGGLMGAGFGQGGDNPDEGTFVESYIVDQSDGEDQPVKLLDISRAYELEAERMRAAGPRYGSTLSDDWTPPGGRTDSAYPIPPITKWAGGTVRVSRGQPIVVGPDAVLYESVVTPGIDVPHKGANVHSDARIVAASKVRAKHQRFAPAGIPGTSEQVRRIMAITLTHDCANHLTGVGNDG